MSSFSLRFSLPLIKIILTTSLEKILSTCNNPLTVDNFLLGTALLVLRRPKCTECKLYKKDKGLFQKKSTHPRRMGSFFNPPSHLDFLKHKTPPPNWISKVEDPPSRLDFREKNKRLKFIFNGKYTQTRLNVFVLISKASAYIKLRILSRGTKNERSKKQKCERHRNECLHNFLAYKNQ